MAIEQRCWRIDNVIYDTLTFQLWRSGEKKPSPPLPPDQAQLLNFFIATYPERLKYKTPQLVMQAAWGEEKSGNSLYKSAEKLRKALGDSKKEIIKTGPYRLESEPLPILCPSISVSASPSPTSFEPATRKREDFTLVVDGMIINSVAELLVVDPQTDGIRKQCRTSYIRCLEDLAFATVYASRLVTSKDFRPSITQPDQPGQEVAARLGEMCDQRPYPSEITGGKLLQVKGIREGIRADIQHLAACVTDRNCVRFFRDYMRREAAKHLGEDNTLFQEDLDPAKYEFNVGRPYYVDRPLQDSLGSSMDILVTFLPEHPPNATDRYAKNALREFATRNVLSLITIMWESDEFAKRTKAWRMPHVLRASVQLRRSLHRAETQQQEILREFVVEQALTTALLRRRMETRKNLVAELLNLRDVAPFKQIREILNQEHLLFVEPGPKREQNARRVYNQMKALIGTNLLQADYFQLAHNSALRTLNASSTGFSAKDYELELYRVFPELEPETK